MSGDIRPGTACEGQDDLVLDQRALRRCLGQFATGVTVMTAQAGGELAGVTANSFSSLSLDPPLILWSIGKLSRSLPVFQAATHFAVNILAADQVQVSQTFSRPDPDRFSKAPWALGPGGAPLLEGTVATIVCRPEAFHDGGDHVLIVGRVVLHAQRDAPVLLFSQGRYGVAEDHPELKPSTPASTAGDALGEPSSPLLRLLSRAQHVTSANFEELRRAEQLTVAQIRLLASLSDGDGQTEQLAARACLGQRDTEDAIADLVALGYVQRDAADTLSLTPAGHARRDRFRRRTAEVERAFLADFPPAEVEIGRLFLARLIAKHSAPPG
jgi:flavin reductase (DIM6/NTAB) family NADH-FMN oxidoreductase RutF/DNA-binding MarR family transcriptional regulator